MNVKFIKQHMVCGNNQHAIQALFIEKFNTVGIVLVEVRTEL